MQDLTPNDKEKLWELMERWRIAVERSNAAHDKWLSVSHGEEGKPKPRGMKESAYRAYMGAAQAAGNAFHAVEMFVFDQRLRSVVKYVEVKKDNERANTKTKAETTPETS